MTTILDRQTQLVMPLLGLSNWEEKYRAIITIGQTLAPYPDEWRTEDFKVKGCQSQVWLHPQLEADGRVVFAADSDAVIVKGLVAMLLKVYSGATPKEILDTQPDFIKQLDLGSHLSPSRANGLFAMIKQIKYYAAAYDALARSKQ